MIVAGAGSRRLGGADKALVDVGGRTLLRRALDTASGAAASVVVGPPRPGYDVTWCHEDPPGGGPVAAFAAGLARTQAQVVLLLAVDLPFAGPAVPELVRALNDSADLSVLVDGKSRPNYLASAWHRASVLRALADLGTPRGASMRTLVRALRMVEVPDRGGWSQDCDTWEQIEAARSRLTEED